MPMVVGVMMRVTMRAIVRVVVEVVMLVRGMVPMCVGAVAMTVPTPCG
jgi:hypothetical protein